MQKKITLKTKQQQQQITPAVTSQKHTFFNL